MTQGGHHNDRRNQHENRHKKASLKIQITLQAENGVEGTCVENEILLPDHLTAFCAFRTDKNDIIAHRNRFYCQEALSVRDADIGNSDIPVCDGVFNVRGVFGKVNRCFDRVFLRTKRDDQHGGNCHQQDKQVQNQKRQFEMLPHGYFSFTDRIYNIIAPHTVR